MSGSRRAFMLGGGAMLCGCAGTIHDLPSAGSAQIASARDEIAARDNPMRRSLSDAEVGAVVRRVHARLHGPAHAMCQEIGQGPCDWILRISRSREVNASASGRGSITINAGIVEMARNDDEVALVVGHEMAHHAANHIARTRSNMEVAGAVGAVIAAGVLVAAAAGGVAFRGRGNERVARDGQAIGQSLGRLAFSRDQEREADHLSAMALHRAGYDLAAARGFMVTLARLSGRSSSSWLNTHPAGPERLAHYDAGMAEILAGRAQPVRRARPA